MVQNIVPVILCGGSGSRLWPLSRQKSPKQFLPLIDGQSLFDKTVRRSCGVLGAVDPLFVTTDDHKYLVEDALATLGQKGTILVEPEGRNTAAALCTAALWVVENHPEALMLVLPSDQLIADEANFYDVVRHSCKTAQNGGWVLIGVKVDSPSAHLGYIFPDQFDVDSVIVRKVAGFVEKPAEDEAVELVENNWLWHAGISIVAAQTILTEIESVAPLIGTGCKSAFANAVSDAHFTHLSRDDYVRVPKLAIDKCLFEDCDKLFVARLDGGWCDVGSFQTLQELAPDFGDGNRVDGDVLLKGTKRTYVRSPHRLIVAVGVEDLNIIDTQDALLVARKGACDQLYSAFETLQAMGRPETITHKHEARPWGHYYVIAETPFYKVKCVLIRPGCAISMQFHYHRAEHWVVVKGQATVTCDNAVFVLSKDQSTFIPQGSIHRIQNNTDEDLELVEVQTGSTLSEDDIVRLDDVYGRT